MVAFATKIPQISSHVEGTLLFFFNLPPSSVLCVDQINEPCSTTNTTVLFVFQRVFDCLSSGRIRRLDLRCTEDMGK